MKKVSEKELAKFNKELGVLCAKYKVTLQIQSNPQLVVSKI